MPGPGLIPAITGVRGERLEGDRISQSAIGFEQSNSITGIGQVDVGRPAIKDGKLTGLEHCFGRNSVARAVTQHIGQDPAAYIDGCCRPIIEFDPFIPLISYPIAIPIDYPWGG